MFINNLKAYAIVHDLERRARHFVSETLATNIGPEWWELVPTDISQRAEERKDGDRLEIGEDVETKDDIEYTDFSDLWAILRDRDFRHLFPREVTEKLSEIEDAVTTVKTYRDTVMHSRVLTTAGLEQLMAAVTAIGTYLPQIGVPAVDELSRLDRDRFYQKTKFKELRDAVRVSGVAHDLNNLPPPDFDDFIGRRKHLEDVSRRLRSKYFPIVSIDGVGGVGKSALAYAAAERLWHSSDRPFSALVYVSAKGQRLTPGGIERLIPTLTTYESLLDMILSVTRQDDALDLKFEKKQHVVRELLASQPVLLILDNLETVSDERIYEFVKDWEYPGKILITSRKRLGELERVIHVPEMQDTEGIVLVRSVGKGLGLTGIVERPNEKLLPLVRRAGNIPLAIKWLLGQVALGRSLGEVSQEIVAGGGPVLDFCFAEVVDALSEEAKVILMCLPLFQEAPSQGALVAASGLDVEEFDHAIQQLVMASLVGPEVRFASEASEAETVYSALPLTLAFAAGMLERHPELERQVTDRLGQFQEMLSLQERATTSLKYSLQNVGAKTDLGRIAAFQALAAMQTYRSGNVEAARQQFTQAYETDHTVHGILLLWADMEEAEGDRKRANELMGKAAQLAPEDAKLWFAWGLMRKKSQHLANAQEYLEKALTLDPNYFWSRFHLATIYSWNERYELGQEELQRCEGLPEVRADWEYYHPVILSGQAEGLRRWADHLLRPDTRNVDKAIVHITRALELGEELHRLQFGNPKTEMLIHEVQETAGVAYYYARDFERARQHFERAIFRRPVTRKEAWRNSEVNYRYALLERSDGNLAKAREHVKFGLRSARDPVRSRLQRLREEIDAELAAHNT